ncbi:hypothetical protein GACE_0045 [Geoglobus acetivorans]|uniref:Uncharacterized protein n=2 Tax=Geoglobus acetivorans TaxID=565033 RepID=A0A0A7GAN0_GEOAI|nr:hypothetical protein GACE_0045 [Geoglobus acetivorans]
MNRIERLENKIDRILELLEDLVITEEEISLIKEADEIVSRKEFDRLVKL